MPAVGRVFFILTLLLSFSVEANLSINRKTVRFGLTKAAPLSYVTNWKAAGLFGAVGTRILEDMGYIVIPVEVPFSRLYESVHRGAIDVAAGVLKTEKRSKLAHYTVPILNDYSLLAVNKRDPIAMNTLSDLSGETLGIVAGFTFPRLSNVPNVRFEPAENERTSLRRLASGRIRGVITSSIRGVTLIQRDPKLVGVVDLLPFAIEEVALGFALSKTAFSEEEVGTFNSALTRLKNSPEWGKILEKEDISSLIRKWPLAQ